MLTFTLGMGFTGQLLRWIQRPHGRCGRGEQAGDSDYRRLGARFILGGNTIGGATTLAVLFAIHVFVLPESCLPLFGLHLWLVLRHGISEPPVAGKPVNPATYRAEYESYSKKRANRFGHTGVARYHYLHAVNHRIAVAAFVVGLQR